MTSPTHALHLAPGEILPGITELPEGITSELHYNGNGFTIRRGDDWTQVGVKTMTRKQAVASVFYSLSEIVLDTNGEED
jgi:hypothetical protein